MLHPCCMETKCGLGLPQFTLLLSLNLWGLRTVMKTDLRDVPLWSSPFNLSPEKDFDYL